MFAVVSCHSLISLISLVVSIHVRLFTRSYLTVTAEGYCCCLLVSFCSVSGNCLYTGWPPTHKEGCAADNGPLSKRAKSSLRHIRTSKTHLKFMSRILQWKSICVLCSLPFSLGNILSGKKPQRCHLKVKVWILKIKAPLGDWLIALLCKNAT